jgi:hypothetical protein
MGWIGLGFREDDARTASACNGSLVASPSQTSMTSIQHDRISAFPADFLFEKDDGKRLGPVDVSVFLRKNADPGPEILDSQPESATVSARRGA